jgi:hypothetical protein
VILSDNGDDRVSVLELDIPILRGGSHCVLKGAELQVLRDKSVCIASDVYEFSTRTERLRAFMVRFIRAGQKRIGNSGILNICSLFFPNSNIARLFGKNKRSTKAISDGFCVARYVWRINPLHRNPRKEILRPAAI